LVTTSWDDGDCADFKLAELLSSKGIRGTFYIPINYRKKPLGHAELRTLAAEGFEIGAHGWSHKRLWGLQPEELGQEVKPCKEVLEDILGRRVQMFCYPRGRYDANAVRAVQQAGYRGARTVRMLATRLAFNAFEMPTTLQVFPHATFTYLKNVARARSLELRTCSRRLRVLIGEQSEWKIAAEAKDGREAVIKANQLKPDVAILDISMPLLNGLEATRQIAKVSPGTKVLILTVHDADLLVSKVIHAGARGYVLKTDLGRDLIAAVTALLANKTFFTAKAAQIVMDGYLGKGPKASGEEFSQITGREREVVQLLAEGKSSKEVATILGITTKTAGTHRTNLMRKLNCHSVTELVRYAVRNHLVEA
jgi:DNA-binding NarL/FixJ family response regulator